MVKILFVSGPNPNPIVFMVALYSAPEQLLFFFFFFSFRIGQCYCSVQRSTSKNYLARDCNIRASGTTRSSTIDGATEAKRREKEREKRKQDVAAM